MPNIKLESCDGHVFDVDVKIAENSIVIKTMLEDLGMSEEDQKDPIPLPNVKGSILKKVLEWATYHKDDPPAIEDKNLEKRTDDICEWDMEFLKVNTETLMELISAANYLNINGLLQVTCKSVANIIKCKTPDQIIQTFKNTNYSSTKEENYDTCEEDDDTCEEDDDTCEEDDDTCEEDYDTCEEEHDDL